MYLKIVFFQPTHFLGRSYAYDLTTGGLDKPRALSTFFIWELCCRSKLVNFDTIYTDQCCWKHCFRATM